MSDWEAITQRRGSLSIAQKRRSSVTSTMSVMETPSENSSMNVNQSNLSIFYIKQHVSYK